MFETNKNIPQNIKIKQGVAGKRKSKFLMPSHLSMMSMRGVWGLHSTKDITCFHGGRPAEAIYPYLSTRFLYMAMRICLSTVYLLLMNWPDDMRKPEGFNRLQKTSTTCGLPIEVYLRVKELWQASSSGFSHCPPVPYTTCRAGIKKKNWSIAVDNYKKYYTIQTRATNINEASLNHPYPLKPRNHLHLEALPGQNLCFPKDREAARYIQSLVWLIAASQKKTCEGCIAVCSIVEFEWIWSKSKLKLTKIIEFTPLYSLHLEDPLGTKVEFSTNNSNLHLFKNPTFHARSDSPNSSCSWP